MLERFAYSQHLLEDTYLEACSEESLVIKFWAYPFEQFFERQQQLFLQWGETISPSCKNSHLNMKLDIRIILSTQGNAYDAGMGEVAKVKAQTASKFYGDKLKSALASKIHLNDIICSLPYLPPDKVNSIVLPVIQIMGLDCHVYTLRLVEKHAYLIQDAVKFSFPRSLQQMRDNGIGEYISGLHAIAEMIDKLENDINGYSKNTADKIDGLISKKNANKKSRLAYLTSPVDFCWESDSETEEEE
ncbi:hypothetical protein DM01DRAFT_267575 [Hesseltinella vesiculosa]|uniref:Uncharacterized protein n=1 Tax=Hesseltinella vesiculosa TaxID=101127 RepID=A0A1X2GWW4_9FUNG|nr:hypothetical protein DM01DRAFT_267575 [Hesseltinella vesiculosa]